MTTQTHTVTVDYSLSVEALIKKGGYDWKNNDINDANFPDLLIRKYSIEKLEITLIGFNKYHSSKWVIKHLKSKGYRQATLKELLSLGAQHPDLQRKDWIVALGSTWRSPSGDLGVPCLGRSGSNRDLRLGWFGGDWVPGWRFACCRLDSGKLKPSKDTSDTLTLSEINKKLDRIIKHLGVK